MQSFGSSAGMAAGDVPLYHIMYVRPVVFLLEQFQGFSSAQVAGYQQVVYMFKELKLKFIIIRDNQAVLVVQVVSADFAFAQRNLFRASNAVLNQLKRLLDEFIVQIFVDYNLFNSLIGYFKGVYRKIFNRGIKQLRAEQSLIIVRARFFLSWCVL